MAFKHFAAVAKPANYGSKHQTPTSVMLDTHYASLSLVTRWDWTRFARLATFLQLTPWELASLAMIRHEALDAYKRTSVLPVMNPLPTAFILTLIEAQALKGWSDDIIPNPFPSLTKVLAKAADEPAHHCTGDASSMGAARRRGRPRATSNGEAADGEAVAQLQVS